MGRLGDGVDVDEAEDRGDGGDDADRPPVEAHGGHDDRNQGASGDHHTSHTVDRGPDTRRGDLASEQWRSSWASNVYNIVYLR